MWWSWHHLSDVDYGDIFNGHSITGWAITIIVVMVKGNLETVWNCRCVNITSYVTILYLIA